ncbi:hypothetical protein GOP47_0003418, partial [Adiantum capillus-veneris]
ERERERERMQNPNSSGLRRSKWGSTHMHPYRRKSPASVHDDVCSSAKWPGSLSIKGAGEQELGILKQAPAPVLLVLEDGFCLLSQGLHESCGQVSACIWQNEKLAPADSHRPPSE